MNNWLNVLCAFSFICLAFPIAAQTNLNVADFGAVGDVERFYVNTEANSGVVSVAGTNVFSAADIGKVIEVFGAGPPLQFSNDPPYAATSFYGNNPNNQTVVTQQDIICLITNVSQGTNLSLSIPCGYTMNAYCVVGSNNQGPFQGAINAATAIVAGGQYTNVTINIPAGIYLIVSDGPLNPDYVMSGISDTHPALTVSSGGITFLGASVGSTILMGCGAGMEHRLNSTFPYGSLGFFNPMRDTLIWCKGPVANNQYPLVFANLTMDGGVQNGLQSYNYWMLYEGNGEGWDTTHHAVADWDGTVSYQMNQMKVFTNCVFQHWRGEMLICWTGDIPNGFNDIANCTFYDGNATADNMYYGQHVHGCLFQDIVKVMEYYQGNASLPSVFEDNVWTNIAGNAALVINGATTNVNPPSFLICNNTLAATANNNQIMFTPAENVTVSNNVFYGQGTGLDFTGAGLQPANGTASVISNIVVVGNSFNNALGPIYMDGYPVENVLVSNNTSIWPTGFASAAGGWKMNIVFANNSGGGLALDSSQVQSGQYFNDQRSDNLNWYQYSDSVGITNYISYAHGHRHQINQAMTNSVFQIITNSFIPLGATWQITNSSTAVVSVSGAKLQPGQSEIIVWTNSALVPQLQFTATPASGMVPLATQFSSPSVDYAGNAIVSWSWKFGDGSASTLQNPLHAYSTAGIFNPALTVTNVSGTAETAVGPAIMVGRPQLALSFNSSNLAVAWSTNSAGYSLQFTTNIMVSPVVWTPVTSAPTVVNGQNVVTGSMLAAQMFFRLVP